MIKIKNLELLRIIACFSIIFYHLLYSKGLLNIADIDLYKNLYSMAKRAPASVELFFILSGFFFVYTLNTNFSVIDFVKKKLIRLYPVFIFVFILMMTASLFGAFIFDLDTNISSLFLLYGTGLVSKSGTIVQWWYVSAMFWNLLLFFVLRKFIDKKYVDVFAIIALLISYTLAILESKQGHFSATHNKAVFYFYNIGMFRALAGISLGYLIGEWYVNNLEKLKTFVFSNFHKGLFTFLETSVLSFLFYFTLISSKICENDIIFVFAYFLIIVLFLLKQGYISSFLENDIFPKISRYTYSLFMSHTFVIYTLKGLVWTKYPLLIAAHPIFNIFITIFLIALLGIFTYHVVEEPCSKYLSKQFITKKL